MGEDDRVRSRRVAVAATGQQALEAGLAVAEDGGNAVDAALASAFVTLATEPGVVSLGGGAYVAVWPVGGDPVVVDGNVEMPGRGGDAARLGRGIRELVTDYGGGVTMFVGPGSVATPGIVPAFAVAAERYAGLPWARLVAPAVQAARSYPLGAAAARYLGHVTDSLFAEDDEARDLVTGRGGSAPRAGRRCANDALADTLVRLAAEGPDLFADGDVGRALVAAMGDQGGLITADDLAAYEPVVRPAHRLTVGDWEIATNPPPSVGGPMLAVMLGELARRADWTWDDAIEIQRRVLGYRTSVHDLSPDLEADGIDLLARIGEPGSQRAVPVVVHGPRLGGRLRRQRLCGDDEQWLQRRDVHPRHGDPPQQHARRGRAQPAGSACSATGNPAGVQHGTDHGTHPQWPASRPLAIGSPGADRITTALMLVLGQGCLHGRDLRHAIAAPRLHLRLRGDGFVVEHERDEAIAAAVARSGLPGHEYPEPHMYFGGVGAALETPDGHLVAAGDARREAATGVSGDRES